MSDITKNQTLIIEPCENGFLVRSAASPTVRFGDYIDPKVWVFQTFAGLCLFLDGAYDHRAKEIPDDN